MSPVGPLTFTGTKTSCTVVKVLHSLEGLQTASGLLELLQTEDSNRELSTAILMSAAEPLVGTPLDDTVILQGTESVTYSSLMSSTGNALK